MTAIAAAELAWHYRMINASIAAMHIKRDPPAPETPDVQKPPTLSPDAPGYHAIGLKAPPTCFLGGARDIDAGFLGETLDNYLVFAFRGTLGSGDTSDTLAICLDWTQDRLYDPKPWSAVEGVPYGNTCEGFSAALTSLWPAIATALARVQWLTVRGIWITGHSKGGAMAALAASRVQHVNSNGNVRPKVVTFGAPMVGDGDFLSHYTAVGLKDNTTRYQNQHDPVPVAPSQKTPGMTFPGCTAVQGDVDAQTGYHHLGELRYISRDPLGRYEIKVGDGYELEYALSLPAIIGNLPLAGAAHNPSNNYLSCFRLAET